MSLLRKMESGEHVVAVVGWKSCRALRGAKAPSLGKREMPMGSKAAEDGDNGGEDTREQNRFCA